MYPSRPTAFGMEYLHEAFDLGQNTVKGARFKAAISFMRIAVHRIARPNHVAAFAFHRAGQLRQAVDNFIMPIARNQRQPPRFIIRVKHINQAEQFFGR